MSSSSYSLPAVHALHLAEVASRFGVRGEDLLAGLGRDPEQLAEPGARLSVAEVIDLIERARRLTGEPGIGLLLGMQMQISAHGYVGFAAMAASTVGEALALAERYMPTRTSALALELRVELGVARLRMIERADLGAARDALVFALMVGIVRLGAALTGTTAEGRMEVAFDEPDYFARLARLGGVGDRERVSFGRPANQLVFDASILEVKMAMADPEALRLAREQCERELEALARDDTAAMRARRLVLGQDGSSRSLEEVARRIGLSPRTLKRRLADEGTTFTAVLDGERRDRALAMVAEGALTLDEIASRLGYSDAPSFARAFRRWTGTSPRAYRSE